MKKLAISSIVCLAMAATAFGQGAITYTAGAFGRIYDDPSIVSPGNYTGIPNSAGTPIPGGQNYRAQLFGYNPNTSSWVPLVNGSGQSPTWDFLSGSSAQYGYLSIGTDNVRIAPWMTANGSLQITIRVWSSGNVYTTWDDAYAAWQSGANVRIGQANPVTVTANVTPSPPQSLPNNTLGSFAIVSGVPEPSTLALGMLGVAGLLFFRRK